MKWKDVSLKWKFGIGFGSVLLLLGVLGLWSVVGIGGIVSNAEQVIEGNKLKGNFVQRIVDHLRWTEKLNTFLTDDTIHTLDIETDPTKCALGKWYYGEGRTSAEKLVPAVRPYLEQIEPFHNALHQSAVEIRDKYVAIDQHLGGFFREKQVDHLNWMNAVVTAIVDRRSGADVQLDPTQCALGKWLYSDEVQALRGEMPEFDALLAPIYEPHKALHESVREVNRLLATGNPESARQYYYANTDALARQTLKTLDGLIAWHDKKIQGLSEARSIYTDKTLPALAQVQGLLEKTSEVVSENIMTDMQMLEAASGTRSMIEVVGTVAAILGILLAWVIARGILLPLRKGVDFASQGSTGDLDATVDVDQ
ncbi:MAG: CZB domain-containing protein [Desulfovibrionaceae bacterium]